jgi:tetratricopeptide (TPR) repeat protein
LKKPVAARRISATNRALIAGTSAGCVSMNDSDRHIMSVFCEALGREVPQERAAYLDAACGQDADLRARVEALLRAHQGAGVFLGGPALATGTAATLEQAVAERPGAVIGPYKLLEQIGEGGMGLVFVAEQQQPVRRKVALKVLKPGMDTRQVIARFEAERQALALMDHPHIAHVFDGGQTPAGRPYFVMELVRGVPITDFCDQSHLPIRERLALFVDVCLAVQHAHQKGIIHRDLKPSNVLVVSHDGTPVAKVIDFGIAKAVGQQLTDKTIYTHFAQLVGTPLYMSPEQAGQSGLDVDTRSDIYSLGVLLYELLTGTTPFEKERLKEVGFDELCHIIREEEPPRPSTRISTLGPAATPVSTQRRSDPKRLSQLFRGELDWIVMKALEKDRNRRYETASAFAADVQRYLHDEPVQACPPSAWYRLRKLARRNKVALTTAALVLGALLLGAGVSLWQAVRVTVANAELEVEQGQTRAALEAEAKRRRQARTAMDAMSSEFITEWLARQPKLLPEHKAFLEKALTSYKEFAADTSQDEESQAGVADAHHRVARIQELLGQRPQAEAAYRRSRDLYAALAAAVPTKPTYRHALTGSHTDLGFFLQQGGRTAEAEATYRQGLAIQQQLVEDFPGVAGYWQGLAVAHGNLATLWKGTSRLKEAEAAYGKVLAIFEKLVKKTPLPAHAKGPATRHYLPDDLDPATARALIFRQGLATSHHNLGNLYRVTGRPAAAVAAHRRALAIQKPLAEAFPKVAEYREDMARTYGNLGNALAETGPTEEAEAAYRQAVALWKGLTDEFPVVPAYPSKLAEVSDHLGSLLCRARRFAEAEKLYRQALALRQQVAGELPAVPSFEEAVAVSHLNLGNALRFTGRAAEAEQAYEQAQAIYRQLVQRFPQTPSYRHGLAGTLLNLADLLRARQDLAVARRLLDEAVPELERVTQKSPENVDYRKDLALAHRNLGLVLQRLGEHPDDALREFRKAIALNPKDADAHLWLGDALRDQGQRDDAITEYRKALALEPKSIAVHTSLASELAREGKLEEAVALFREAVTLDPKYGPMHYNLGTALSNQGKLDEAIAEFRKAIALKDDRAEVHCNLGNTLRRRGEFHEALEELRRGHEMGSKRPGWRSPSAQWVRQCERLVELDERLPALLAGKSKPASPAERIELAGLCCLKRFHRGAARFYAEAFAAEPKLADELDAHRYNAACAAALAGCGQGRDARGLDDKERARLHKQGLAWLRADLEAWGRLLDMAPDPAGPAAARALQHWLADADFAGVRGPEALARLPEAEREAWQHLWNDVADMLRRAREETTSKN